MARPKQQRADRGTARVYAAPAGAPGPGRPPIRRPLRSFDSHRGGIDLVIADLKMPGLDGSELLQAIRAFSEIPVIIITAYGTEEAAAEVREKGVFDFILKPFRKEQIVLAIERGLAWSTLQRENRALRERLAPPAAG